MTWCHFNHHSRACVQLSRVTLWTHVQMMTIIMEANQLQLFVNLNCQGFFLYIIQLSTIPHPHPTRPVYVVEDFLFSRLAISVVLTTLIFEASFPKCHLHIALTCSRQQSKVTASITESFWDPHFKYLMPWSTKWDLSSLGRHFFSSGFSSGRRTQPDSVLERKVLKGFLRQFGSTWASTKRMPASGRQCKWLPWQRHQNFMWLTCSLCKVLNISCV